MGECKFEKKEDKGGKAAKPTRQACPFGVFYLSHHP